jgi:hypothetical protein
VARSLQLTVLGFEECGLASASTGELVAHADDDSFHGRRRPGSPAPTVTLTARVWWARETAR